MMLVLFMIKQTQDHVFPRSSRFLSTTFQVYWDFRPVSSLLYTPVKCRKSGSDGKESFSNVGDPGLIPGLGRSLEKEIAAHSSILAWEIPWTEEPGRLPSMGSQKSRTQLNN